MENNIPLGQEATRPARLLPLNFVRSSQRFLPGWVADERPTQINAILSQRNQVPGNLWPVVLRQAVEELFLSRSSIFFGVYFLRPPVLGQVPQRSNSDWLFPGKVNLCVILLRKKLRDSLAVHSICDKQK